MSRFVICAAEAEAIACPHCGFVHRQNYGGWPYHDIVCQCGSALAIVGHIQGEFERLDAAAH
jgi:hypothetical protein